MKECKRRKRVFKTGGVFLWMIGLLISVFSCDDNKYEIPIVDPGTELSFSEDILAFIEDQNCAGCHPTLAPPDLTSGNVYESLMDGYVDTDTPENSKIYTKFEGGHAGYNTDNVEIQKILIWIQQGAENN